MFIMLDKLLKHARFILGFSQPLDQGGVMALWDLRIEADIWLGCRPSS